MKIITLAPVIVSALSQLGAAQDTEYKLSCKKSVFGGIPDAVAHLAAATNVCTNGMGCVGPTSIYQVLGLDTFLFTCKGCKAGLPSNIVAGCEFYNYW
ncbi:hypothetical protein QTJ16_004304 [Diplocarpon rosae]|uniref:Uncharacterized protein n=1 Tax=Diplocarpon rosae TaxID=946125 RepID=A0AAD9WC40_9HELO|nr:hypothetical protein QTJ16_004304 [Diplocarpon rosae]